MAIPTTNINLCADVANQIYGDRTVACISLGQALCSVNLSLPNTLLSFANCSASLTRSPTTAAWVAPGTCTITVTAKSAWSLSIAQTASPPIWSLSSVSGKVTLNGSSPTGTFGGSGVFAISRNSNACIGATGTVTITYSNGAGGSSTTTVTLTTSY